MRLAMRARAKHCRTRGSDRSQNEYRQHWLWVGNEDFDSKVAFTLLRRLLQLAKTSGALGAVITIPAG